MKNKIGKNLNEMNHYVQEILRNLFEMADDEMIRQIYKSGNLLEIETGDFLFHQGDLQNQMYIVLYGRLRALSENEGNVHLLGDIDAGETVGELAFLT